MWECYCIWECIFIHVARSFRTLFSFRYKRPRILTVVTNTQHKIMNCCKVFCVAQACFIIERHSQLTYSWSACVMCIVCWNWCNNQKCNVDSQHMYWKMMLVSYGIIQWNLVFTFFTGTGKENVLCKNRVNQRFWKEEENLHTPPATHFYWATLK